MATVTPTVYIGKVWCVQVATGAFIARRNGKIFITGNSGFPKATRIDTQIDDAAGEVQTVIATPLAREWGGHRYGQQALKPAAESVLIFRKPYEGKPIDSIVRHGAGALNVEMGRVGENGGSGNGLVSHYDGLGNCEPDKKFGPDETNTMGRWPANLALSHSPNCADSECVDGCPVAELDEQVSRFFHVADYAAERIEQAAGVRYQAKAGRGERDAGLENLPLSARPTMGDGIGGQPNQRIKNNFNTHATVKPIALTRWLASLLLPPDSYVPRRLLVPFAGSGSEMIGALLAGWEDVLGIELEREYADIARARLAWWTYQPRDVAEQVISAGENDSEVQLSFV